MKYYLAIDIGASSGRHILGHVENGQMILEEIWRFENRQIRKNGHDCWDMDNLWKGILDGLKTCKQIGKIPATIGIDTWSTDYILLDSHGHMIGDAIAYRDKRTEGMKELVNQVISADELYERTGMQYLTTNTIYQLTAHKRENPQQLEQAEWLLFIPEYFNYLLTGLKQNEYTVSSCSNLVNVHTLTWDWEVISALGLPDRIFHPLAMPGETLGHLRPEIRDEIGFDAVVVLPATHDTGSAFLAVPAMDDQAVYLSSGTWSLLGVENDHAITSPESHRQNFTNEGGAWYRYRYLKNIMGLWVIQSIRRELNGVAYISGREHRVETAKKWTFPDLIHEARKEANFPSIVDINDDCFFAPVSMIEAVKAECARTGQQVPANIGQLMQCVYASLADCYRRVIISLEALTNKKYTSINIVGGGCQDQYLNQLTAETTELPVFSGPVEGTAIGNLMIQMMMAGEYPDLATARTAVRNSFDIQRFYP